MKLLTILGLIGLSVASEFYDSKYDDFDVDELENNPRLFKSFAQCFIGVGKCTPDGSQIKGWIPEAIESSCGKCTEIQKILVARFITIMKVKYTKDYERFLSKFNPQGKYNRELDIFLAKYSKSVR